MLLLFFFFKQKTAYDMRISDWSSDVCSSDLFSSPSSCASTVSTSGTTASPSSLCLPSDRERGRSNEATSSCAVSSSKPSSWSHIEHTVMGRTYCGPRVTYLIDVKIIVHINVTILVRRALNVVLRSEERTSALQSLMRISYAVFCLK